MHAKFKRKTRGLPLIIKHRNLLVVPRDIENIHNN